MAQSEKGKSSTKENVVVEEKATQLENLGTIQDLVGGFGFYQKRLYIFAYGIVVQIWPLYCVFYAEPRISRVAISSGRGRERAISRNLVHSLKAKSVFSRYEFIKKNTF